MRLYTPVEKRQSREEINSLQPLIYTIQYILLPDQVSERREGEERKTYQGAVWVESPSTNCCRDPSSRALTLFNAKNNAQAIAKRPDERAIG